jgi:uncharacterized membrane protein (TIGR02234 family)
MKSRGLAFGCLLVGGALALVASAQPWWRGDGHGAAVKFTGGQATGGLSQALGIVALAGTLLLLALRSRGRRVVAALLLLIGVGVALVGGIWLQPRPDAVRGQLGHISMPDSFQLTATVWPWVFAVTGVLIVGGAAVTMITAGSWPAGSDRFQTGSGSVQAAMSDETAELWKAMDAGVDPTTTAADSPRDARATAHVDDHDTLTPSDPKMRDRGAGDTMDDTEQAQQLPWSPTSPSSGQVHRGRRGRREA